MGCRSASVTQEAPEMSEGAEPKKGTRSEASPGGVGRTARSLPHPRAPTHSPRGGSYLWVRELLADPPGQGRTGGRPAAARAGLQGPRPRGSRSPRPPRLEHRLAHPPPQRPTQVPVPRPGLMPRTASEPEPSKSDPQRPEAAAKCGEPLAGGTSAAAPGRGREGLAIP